MMVKEILISTLQRYIEMLNSDKCTADQMNQIKDVIFDNIDPMLTYDEASKQFDIPKCKLVADVCNKVMAKDKPKQYKLGRYSMFKSILKKK